MGRGYYDYEAHEAATAARAALAPEAVFTGRSCDPTMNPRGVTVRECRDSEAHPASVGIVFALDVSGSMGIIPQDLATATLPAFMRAVTQVIPDAQVLFIAFGNAYADRSPLQVGQFESEAHLVDHWLATAHLEGGGGGLGESYDLAMYFASRHTAMDCLAKRGKKGYFFMTGDEVPFSTMAPGIVTSVLGATSMSEPMAIHETALELTRSFNAFFLIPDQARAIPYGTGPTWQKIFHERTIILERPSDTAMVCATLVAIEERVAPDEAAIRAFVASHFGLADADLERVVRPVLPFAAALAQGPIAPPEAQGTQDVTGFKG
ncbi:MAG: VWA domain-containing protein [Myxococcota bacterium]